MAINMKMLKRIVFGAALIALLSLLCWWDISTDQTNWRGAPFAALVAILAAAAFGEFARMADKLNMPTMTLTGALAAALIASEPTWSHLIPFEISTYGLVAASVFVMFFVQMARYKTDSAMRRLASTFFGIMYLGMLPSFIVALRMERGTVWLICLLAIVKSTDIGAYFTGSMFGKHKIIPWLSPGKSWEGLVGGIASSVIVSCVLTRWLIPEVSLTAAAVFGVIMTFVGQFGDLCESLLKRDSRLKDSAVMIPEFGGVLDLVDSPLAAAPVAYWLCKFI